MRRSELEEGRGKALLISGPDLFSSVDNENLPDFAARALVERGCIHEGKIALCDRTMLSSHSVCGYSMTCWHIVMEL